MAAWNDKPVVMANRVDQPRDERGARGDALSRAWLGFRWHEPFTVDPSVAVFSCPEPVERACGDR